MYLAGILGLCALLPGPLLSPVSSEPALFDARPASVQSTPSQPSSQQEPGQPDASKPATSQSVQPDTSQPTQHQPANQPKPVQASPQAPSQKPTPAKPHAPTKKKHTATVAGQPPPKKVVRQGSTADPTTQLAPGISQEQASRQRQTTTQLLSSTDAALHELSGQLTSDQQETVAQIRKFMQQSKAADKDGDSQLAYKLALKAHLLSDGLSKQ